ncbi:MAG: DNA polymerase III subunit gamma/tau [Campylobacteraceae bacterium]
MSQVLALKYRPSSFDKLIGQDAVAQTLSLALNQNRLSHAYLFSGLRGSGKTSTARIFAKALVCDKGPTATPCEVCENCLMANENRHIDIIEMDAASSRKIDDIRDLIEQTKYKPSIARFKIFIIDEVHMLTKEAFNALLKTLEEPPEFVKFILATTDPMKLPATILSRTQHFRFKQISRDDTVKHLSHILNLEHITYKTDALEIVARAGNGSLRDTLTLLDQAIIYSKGDLTASSVASLLGLLDPKKIEDIFNIVFENDRKKLLELCKELESYECETVIDELIAYLKDRYYEQDAKFRTLATERFFRILSEAKSLLFLNADNGFVLTLVFFKMLEALNLKKIDDAIESLEKEQVKTVQTKPLHVKENEPKDEVKTDTNSLHVKQESIKIPEEESSELALFKKFVAMLYDRNSELGECFEKSVTFVSYEDGALSLNSAARDECKQVLRQSSAIIRHLMQEVFGIETRLVMTQIKPEIKEESRAVKKEEAPKPQEPKIEKKEENILENEFVKKAIELLAEQ